MRFFFDNDLSPKIVQALCALGADAVHLKSQFRQTVRDTDWIPQVAGEGMAAVTADLGIRTCYEERCILRDCGLRAFFICRQASQMLFWEQAAWFIRHWPEIERVAFRARPGECFDVGHNGKVLPARFPGR
jgi:hypothetical protein